MTDTATASPASSSALPRVAVIGLGKLGLNVAGALVDRRDLDLVAAVDTNPRMLGADLGTLLGSRPFGLAVTRRLTGEEAVDLAVLTTASYLADVSEQLHALVCCGIDVVTSAEELGYPWHEFPRESAEIDALARAHGVSVLGAGANPGFLMDVLPITLTLGSQEVERIAITRTLDLRPQRPGRAGRFGIGVEPAQLAGLPSHAITGHVGFRQSIDAIADALGWALDAVEVTPVTPAVVAETARDGDFFRIEPGQVAVVEQYARGLRDGAVAIELHEYFGFIDADDPLLHGDTYEIVGADQSFTASVQPGIRSYVTTPAVLVNLVRPTIEAPPGLLASVDFRVRDLAAKGAWRTPREPREAGTEASPVREIAELS